MNSIQNNNIASLCRIKVNKMLSSLNTNNQNIFIPKYTLTKKSESKYLSKLNTKQTKKINSKKINNTKKPLIQNKKNENNKSIDFIINHGVLVYQRNIHGEEVINYGISNNKIINNKNTDNKNNNIAFRTENNFNKKKLEKNKSIKTIHTERNIINISLASNNKENCDINTNNELYSKKIIKKKKSCNYIKPSYYKNMPIINSEKNNIIIYIITKIEKIFYKKIKNIFNILKYNYIYQKNTMKHKKSNSIIVNKKLVSNLIPKNFNFFSKEKKSPELYRDSKSLEKKYEQICRRKKLNMTMTFTEDFRKKIYLNVNNNILSQRNNNSFSLKDTYNTMNIKNNRITNNNYYSPSTINNSKINAISDNSQSNIENFNYKINVIDNYNKDNIINYRIDKNPLFKKNISYNFSFNDSNAVNKKISLHKKYFYKNKSKSNKKIKNILEKENTNNNELYTIKNICTKDQRIFIHINYLPFLTKGKKRNIRKKLLNISKILEYNYIPKKRFKKRINKRKNIFEKKLSLIKEEEEKNTSIKIKENNSINSYSNNKLKYFNISFYKLVDIIEKNIYMKKYEFFLKLNKLIKIESPKRFDKHISNIIIKDKIFLNNIFINNDKTLFCSRSLDFGKGFNIIDSSTLKSLKKRACSKDNINF